MKVAWIVAAVVAAALAGCTGDPETPEADDVQVDPPAPADHILDGTVEPTGLEAPGFSLLGALAEGGPVYGAGEPSIWVHLDGTVYAAFPGCDSGPYYLLPNLPGQERCEHGLVYRSDDGGATWKRLNRAGDGRLTDEGPAANGDADVTVDAAGTVYTSDLGGGIQVFRSDDRGAAWSHVGDVVPEGHWADRQWMAAGGPGHLVMAWMGGTDQPFTRQVAVNTTFDGGKTWTGVEYLGDGIGWLGTAQFAPDGGVYVPFTQNDGNSVFSLRVAHSPDGGVTWHDMDTGATVTRSTQGGHWAGVLMAPALDVTGDGTVVYAWSEEVLDPTGQTATGTVVKAMALRNGSWSEPLVLSDSEQAVQPWVTGGAGDRFAITWYAGNAPGDSELNGGAWDVRAAVVDGIGDQARVVAATIDEGVHYGPLCSTGSGCVGPYDRALLDFFESDLLPDGRLIVIYPADPLTEGGAIQMRIAVQDAGTRLLERPGAAEASDTFTATATATVSPAPQR